ncbi:MAG TPA: hypothetical protein VH138_03540 [Vicinamibacterales bacterium]|nr:hypothetical protein [Vicinamibacterales bacterium]
MPANVVRNSRASIVLAIFVLASTISSAHAQDRSQPSERSETVLQKALKRVPPPDQGSGFHFTKHLAVVFGGIKPGQGIALGPALSTTFADGGYAQLKGVYSVRNFRLVQARYDTRPFWHRRSMLVTRVRWQDAPDLALYRIGIDSPRDRAQYGEQKTEVSTALDTRITRILHLAAAFGIERYAISTGSVDTGEDHALAGVPLEPGLSTRPWLTHGAIGVAIDTRRSGYARSGTILDAGAGNYLDWHDGTYAFQHLEGGVREFLAVGSRGSVGVSTRAWFSHAGEGHVVPFYLMPTLGGGEALEAFNTYRFRDHDAWWLRAEYRHSVHDMIDAVGFYEAGTVAPKARLLSLGQSVRDAGGGIIVHTRDATLLRLELARGFEGFGLTILFTPGGRL